MNDSLPQTNFELPTPQGAGETASFGAEQQQAPLQPPAAQGPSGPLPAPLNVPEPNPVAMPTQGSVPTPVPAPVIADDSDLIEKEWVQRAKQIVAATKDDPFKQNKELNRFKADYLKKRYNKDVKIEES